MRKGYLFVIVFALFSSIARSFYYRVFIKNDLEHVTSIHFATQILLLFISILIPGLILARWYYKLKDDKR